MASGQSEEVTMMITIILAVCFIPLWFLSFFTLRNTVKPKKNIIIGVTLPHNAHNENETLLVCASFRKWLNIVMMPLLLLMIPPFFMGSMGASMTWLMTWTLMVIIGSMAVFAVHREKLMAVKRANNWCSAAAGEHYLDEDDYWLLGLFYHNPNDSHLMANLSKGNFRVSGYGASRLNIRPLDPPFLVVHSAENIYIVNDADSNVTREIYTQLRR